MTVESLSNYPTVKQCPCIKTADSLSNYPTAKQCPWARVW